MTVLYNVEKNIKHMYRLINLVIIITFSVNGMVFSGRMLSRLDILFQNSIRYNHQKENYERSLYQQG